MEVLKVYKILGPTKGVYFRGHIWVLFSLSPLFSFFLRNTTTLWVVETPWPKFRWRSLSSTPTLGGVTDSRRDVRMTPMEISSPSLRVWKTDLKNHLTDPQSRVSQTTVWTGVGFETESSFAKEREGDLRTKWQIHNNVEGKTWGQGTKVPRLSLMSCGYDR